ncbi:probable glycosyltransferase At5g20260 [Fagus crenata]
MQGNGSSNEDMAIAVQYYVQSLISKYPYWNRKQGADHFFVNCDIIGRMAAQRLPLLNNAIQVVCASGDALEFKPSKDIVLPAFELQPSG